MNGSAGEIGEADAFWSFALDLYARPGVADACVALQDAYGFDVNLILFCAWRGTTRRETISAPLLGDAARALAPWTETATAPLRAVRHALKPSTLGSAEVRRVRALVLEAELAAERHAHLLLLLFFGERPLQVLATSQDAVTESLRAYALALGSPPPVELEFIATACTDAD